MLSIVRDIQTQLYGVLKDSKVLIPVQYPNPPVIQKGGISVLNSNNHWDAFLYDGTKIAQDCGNVLFLNNGLMLYTKGKTYIYNTASRNNLFNIPFNTILFFCGSNINAIPFSDETNIESLTNSNDYIIKGAYFEDLVCANVNGKWGVLNIKTGAIYSNFIYPIIMQKQNYEIIATTASGQKIRL